MMTRQISQATISSLKATHTAHRMATEILNPHIGVPSPKPRELFRDIEVSDIEGLPLGWEEARILQEVFSPQLHPRPRRVRYEISRTQEWMLALWLVILGIAMVAGSISFVMKHL